MFEIDFFNLTSSSYIGASQIGHFIVPSDANDVQSNPPASRPKRSELEPSTRFPAANRSSLSDASLLQLAASAVAEVVSRQHVESAVAGFDHVHVVAR